MRVRALGGLAAVALFTSGLVVASTTSAQADTKPSSGPSTVSADALPTVQINGVVWAQVVVGNTVYVTGKFSKARPAGVARGGKGEVTRANLLAYDIRTGKLNTKFVHTLNGQGLSIARTPKGDRIYVGGDFTRVDGKRHLRIAAFSTKSGALISSFHPTTSSSVRAIAAASSTVYVGGDFLLANGRRANRVAKFRASDGARLRFLASATGGGGVVRALLISPDRKRVIVAGQFNRLNGHAAPGIGAVTSSTGGHLSWSSRFPLKDNDKNAGFSSLATDGKYLYGSGFNFLANHGTGNFEGRFSSTFAGTIRWIDSCHGDTYDIFVQGRVVYSATHAHDCSDMGAWDQTNPIQYHRALAETTYPSGKLLHNLNSGYKDYYGRPKSRLLHWFPTLTAGTYTKQRQAAWSITGNSRYISLGGEFPSVNGVAQQGLVRFAIPSVAPKKVGPIRDATALRPSLSSLAAGTVRVRWHTTWDMDNERLTYRLYRGTSLTTPIYTTTRASNFWLRQWVGFSDTSPGVANGSPSHSYRVTVTDPDGNQVTGPLSSSTVTVASAADDLDAYSAKVKNDHANRYWTLSREGSQNLAGYDRASWDDLTMPSDATQSSLLPHAHTTREYTTFTGVAGSGAVGTVQWWGPGTFTLEAWVRTNSTTGGEIVGFGNKAGTSSSADRQLYFGNDGKIYFGMRTGNGGRGMIGTPAAYNDGNWHYVVATFSPSTTAANRGMRLYVDGALKRASTAVKDTWRYLGYWHVGGDTIGKFTVRPTSGYLAGSLADVAVYSRALTATQVSNHFS